MEIDLAQSAIIASRENNAMKMLVYVFFFCVTPLSAHAAFLSDLGSVPPSVSDVRSSLAPGAYDDFYTFSAASDVSDATIDFALEPTPGFFQAGAFSIELYEGVSSPAGVPIASAVSGGGQSSVFFLADLDSGTTYTLRTTFNFNTSGSAASATTSISAVPIPAAAWLFGSGLAGLMIFARRKTV